jgi:N-acetylmuramoyl-L-alanine amidase
MKHILKILETLLSFTTNKSKTTEKPLQKNKLVALVVGHNQKSKGAYNKDKNIYEYDLNKYEATEVYNRLEAEGIECVIVHRDTYRELPNDINRHNPDFIVSFHHNSYNATATGTETLYYHTSQKGKELAEVLHKRIVDTLKYKDRGLKPKTSEDRGGYLLKETDAPCVILEPCFISNTDELKDFIEKQDEYCEAVAKSIKDFIYI